MDQQIMARFTRRGLLGLGVAGAGAGLFGACAPSPLITPTADHTPQAAPTLPPLRLTAATAAASAAALAAACASAPGADEGFAAWCNALADQHNAHAMVLAQADPLGGVQADHEPLVEITPRPAEVPPDVPTALSALSATESDLVDTLQPALDEPDQDPAMVLLWLSQLLAARVHATVTAGGDPAGLGPAPVAGDAVPAETDTGSSAAAWQVVLSHQHALVFGLQSMLGRVAWDDPAYDVINARLGEAMRERDATSARIVAADGQPEPAAARYTLPGDPADAAQRDQLWGRLELALLAGWARLAAVDAAVRTDALAQAEAQAARARGKGVALSHWPGWV